MVDAGHGLRGLQDQVCRGRGLKCDVYGSSPHLVVGLQPSSGFLQRQSLKPRGQQGALQVIVTPIEPSRDNRCEGFFCPEFPGLARKIHWLSRS